ETMLMWFLRGAGLKGLGGMAPQQNLKLGSGESTRVLMVIRPLLEISKADVLRYLSEKQLAYRVDESNRDPAFLRNWIRTDLLPRIGRRIDSRVPDRLGQLAALLRDEDDYLDEVARQRFTVMLQKDDLARPAFLAQPKALQRRILRLWIERARGHLGGLDFVHIDDMLRLIEAGPPQGSLSIPGGWQLVREYESLKLAKPAQNRSGSCYNYPLEVGVILRIPEASLEFHSELLAGSPQTLPGDLMEAVFDHAYLSEALAVRNFRPGDRFHPLGMTGHKKVKDLYIEKRVPLSVRSRWPLLVAGEEVLWIPGYGRSAAAAVSKKTTTMLSLRVRPI
ncbi:MAG: tRNA lysidine(34) synthetase TilS, partial [Chloroflexota bacterium]